MPQEEVEIYSILIRKHFEKHSHIKSPYTASVLLHQGENDLQEALNVWKTRSHVVKFFEPVETDQRDLISRIWAGESVLPKLLPIDENCANWHYPPPAKQTKSLSN